jgi:hypothetical protein
MIQMGLQSRSNGKASDRHESFWRNVRNSFSAIKETFNLPLETREQALARSARHEGDDEAYNNGFRSKVIRWRETHPCLNARDKIFNQGKALLPKLERHIEYRQLTMKFFEDFAEAKECYGFIRSFILDDSDTLAPVRAGRQRGKMAAQQSSQKRRFVARLLNTHHDSGLTAKEAVRRVAREIGAFIEKERFPDGFDRKWFESLLARLKTGVTLAPVYRENNLTKRKTKEFASLPGDDLPNIRAPTQPATQ